ncbi:uncharacterized protein LOC120417317 [Culex pipiens pallens]|uniref:uncharacterized protein LOC120417317 n=1 Tax=Culex pipiens pallens TaxID=42434 RepID=UPI0019543805|nr:uncharacterized protein LOC120417317 [Culex pipiens pallens]
MYQLLRICFLLPIDIDAFMAVFNMGFIWTVALSRGICFAIYRRELNQLKKYVNARSCQRDNPVANECRKNTYRQNLKLATIFQLYTVINVSIWCFTEFRTNDNFDIPLPMHLLNDKLRLSIEFFYMCVCTTWSITCWINFLQFGMILNCLRTELKIVVMQFEELFPKIRNKLEIDDLRNLEPIKRRRFWIELDDAFINALADHAMFLKYEQILNCKFQSHSISQNSRHHKQLKAASSTNFLIVFSSAMVLISMNMFLFIIDPSVKRIPLLVVSCQFAFEVFICCYLFDSLEQEVLVHTLIKFQLIKTPSN